MPCAKSLDVQAQFDGELDENTSLALDRHVDGCADCQELRRALNDTRALLRRAMPPRAAAPALRSRVDAALDAEDARRRRAPRAWRSPAFWWGNLAGTAATLAAGVVGFLLVVRFGFEPVVDDVVAAHVRSLSTGHLIDVVSTDKHTVKPWFAGRADVSPVVADFAPQGYTLAGGRVETFDRQRFAVTVYLHGAHVIDVFCWPAPRGPLPSDTTRRGYHLAFWRVGDLAYAATSDAGWPELAELHRLLEKQAESDAME